MNNTGLCHKTSYYLKNYSKWPDYMPLPIWILIPQAQSDLEFSCTDSFVKEINKAINEATDPNSHVTYNTVEEFLDSLKPR